MVTVPEYPRPAEATRRSGRSRLRTVALVGIDGSGKTTQAHRLAAELAASGVPAAYRRNAGGRRWFGRLAAALGRRDAEHLLGRSGFLLVESVLRWLAILRTLLRRAVTGEIAIMDRYAVCQYASLRARAADPRPQRGPTRSERRARRAYGLFPRPDVTFLLAVDPRVAYERIESRGYDHESMDYLTAAGAAYRALPEYRDFVVIDADATPDEVAAAIRAELMNRFPSSVPVPSVPVQSVPPAPRPPASLGANTKAIFWATGPLAAGATTVGYRVSEAVRALV
ncbi:MAG TPA: thymidylate kinase [Actinoplanes sp.]